MSTATEEPRRWPTEIGVDTKARTMTVSYEDGRTFTFTAEFLRINSPSAEVQGHSLDQRKTIVGKRNVGFADVEEVGNYALKIVFDDRHDTGIYSWDYLYTLGENQDSIWKAYLAELERKGLSREPR